MHLVTSFPELFFCAVVTLRDLHYKKWENCSDAPPLFLLRCPGQKLLRCPPPTCLFLRCPHLLFFAEMSNSPQFFLALQEKLLRCPPSTFFAKMPRAWILLLRCPPPHFFLLRCSAHLIFLAKLLLRWTHVIFFPEMPNLLIFLALLISACQLLRYGPLFFFSWDAQLFSIIFCGIPASSSF